MPAPHAIWRWRFKKGNWKDSKVLWSILYAPNATQLVAILDIYLGRARRVFELNLDLASWLRKRPSDLCLAAETMRVGQDNPLTYSTH